MMAEVMSSLRDPGMIESCARPADGAERGRLIDANTRLSQRALRSSVPFSVLGDVLGRSDAFMRRWALGIVLLSWKDLSSIAVCLSADDSSPGCVASGGEAIP